MTEIPYSIRYGFSQSFNFPAETAYKWCTDYDPKDLQRMGETGRRRITRLTEDTIILDDKFDSGITKVKLVRLNPESHTWTSTHLSGPIKHSQFLYEIIPEGTHTSHLNFTGLQINYSAKKPGLATVARLAIQLRKEDSHAWKLLAQAMQKELG
jgi:hypothetical protein